MCSWIGILQWKKLRKIQVIFDIENWLWIPKVVIFPSLSMLTKKVQKKLSILFLWSVQYWHHCEKLLSNSIDPLKNWKVCGIIWVQFFQIKLILKICFVTKLVRKFGVKKSKQRFFFFTNVYFCNLLMSLWDGLCLKSLQYSFIFLDLHRYIDPLESDVPICCLPAGG